MNPKDWSPSKPMPSVGDIFKTLKELAPQIAFSVKFDRDENYVWDGDGPDPAGEGYFAYDVSVIARAVAGGELVDGEGNRGGHYQKPGEMDYDISGYLPQLLKDAARELDRNPGLGQEIDLQLSMAIDYLRRVMEKRYNREQGRGGR